jgi:hypothetical protein
MVFARVAQVNTRATFLASMGALFDTAVLHETGGHVANYQHCPLPDEPVRFEAEGDLARSSKGK